MEGAGGPVAAHLHRDMAAARATCERRIAQYHARTMATSAFSGAVLSSRSLAEHSVAHRGVHQEPEDKGVLQAFPSPVQEKAMGKTDYRARLSPTRTRTSTIPQVLFCCAIYQQGCYCPNCLRYHC
ncbi:uncharacterized protein LOC125524320 [Triticum urartu]|uniref:uncharacterized protein LOC125524320 n=1 Tax=Triticum urartu TaxID=4572 RepID=UPI002043D856|nr:uncharacterized protein LOC125524320 [Triticum urartu]XP_048545349.1 uncharacterized protein LOC125524320 [Triticum urartu]